MQGEEEECETSSKLLSDRQVREERGAGGREDRREEKRRPDWQSGKFLSVEVGGRGGAGGEERLVELEVHR